MKLFIYILVLSGCLVVAAVYVVNGQSISAPPPFSTVPESPWMIENPRDEVGAQVYASCASCHLADGSGRRDGGVPSVAGQSETILRHKLQKLRDGSSYLPVMIPFARALTSEELEQVAHYMAELPRVASTTESQLKQGINDSNATQLKYETNCSACHGLTGQGNDALLSPRLCGQHSRYLIRRMTEIGQNLRGDADLAMVSVLKTVVQDDQIAIAQWLETVQCAAEQATTKQEMAGNSNGS